MVAHQVFAVIIEGEVKNVMTCDNYELANQIARDVYGTDALAVDCLLYPCGAGDRYVEGLFYQKDSNIVIEPLPTEKQEIEALKWENKHLQENITNLELALVELYERGV